MGENNVAVAEAYYTAMGEKNLAGVEKHLHPNVHFIGPLAERTGKESFLEAAKGYMAALRTLTIRAKFGSGNQVMLAYDVDFPAPMEKIRTAVLMTLQEGLITKLELFFDGRPFDKKG